MLFSQRTKDNWLKFENRYVKRLKRDNEGILELGTLSTNPDVRMAATGDEQQLGHLRIAAHDTRRTHTVSICVLHPFLTPFVLFHRHHNIFGVVL